MVFDWNAEIRAQLATHWQNQLRPRLQGLTDDEYFWEPAAGAWTIRPDGDRFVADFAVPPPDPAPVTTIAWRIGHLAVVVAGMRGTPRFGGPPVDFTTFPYAGTAAGALDQLDAAVGDWLTAVEQLGTDGLAEPGGADGWSTAAIALHVNREVLHHGAEIALLRDLYRASRGSADEQG